MISFIENTDITGESQDNILNHRPYIVCFPIFHMALYQDGHIAFYEDVEGVRHGPFLRAIGDLTFLYQLPAKYTTKLSQGKHVAKVFNPYNQTDRNKLYGFSILHNTILRKFNQQSFRFYKFSKVCVNEFITQILLYISYFLLFT